MNAPPLSQTQVQFPIIDELADDFAILIAGVNRKVHSLSASRLQGLKALFEEKLKSKGVPITIPSSADELISTISQYWDCLNIEFAQLVVRYLGKKDLQTQMKRYEENLQKKAKILLTQCREKNITPRAPPGCFNMKITVDEDPYSFSLHRILEFKDFLVHRIGMDIALFTGWDCGSIILHFCILEDDMETAVRQLYAHKLELRDMQVVAIEVGDVIVYRDAPIERPPSIAAVSSKIDDQAVAMETEGPIFPLAVIRKTIDELAKCFKQGNNLIDNMQEFGARLEVAIEKTLNVPGEIHNEEIKHIYQVESALDALVVVAQKAFAFFDKVDNVIWYCGSDSMAAAREELRSSVDLQQAGGLW